MKPFRGFGGWRWWSRKGFIYVSAGTEFNWLRLEVGPVEIKVARASKEKACKP